MAGRLLPAGPVREMNGMDQLNTATQRLREAVAKGRQALELDSIEARRDSHLEVGRALIAVRQLFKADREFNAHLVANKLDISTPGYRSDAMWLAENWDGLQPAVNRCTATHPCNIRQWFRDQRREKPRSPLTPQAARLQPAIRAELAAGRTPNLHELGKQYGVSDMPARRALSFEQGRLAGIAEADNSIDAPLDKRTEQAIERKMKELMSQFDLTVAKEVEARLAKRDQDDILRIEQANAVLSQANRLRQPLTPQEYYKVLWATHPDNNSEEKTAEAFIILRRKKHVLCEEGAIARKSAQAPLPATLSDLLARRKTKRA